MGRIILLVFFVCWGSLISYTQLSPLNNTSNKQTKALNNYVYFVNESIHGMLIVHRLLENFNLDINKYVDLDSYQINFYSNKDLPKDIFEDPDNWFYDTSPYEWYEIIENDNAFLKKSLSSSLMKEASELKDIISQINQKRFEIEALISNRDLNDPGQLGLVYEALESCVVLFESFYSGQKNLERLLYAESNPSGIYKDLHSSYSDFKSVLAAIRNKDERGINILIKKLKTSVDAFVVNKGGSRLRSDISFHERNIKSQLKKAIQSCEAYASGKNPPKEYEMYGRYYYYYNSDVINKFNRYGSGIVFEMNAILDRLEEDSPRFIELPHYYKVIYPRRLEKINVIAANNQPLESLPVSLEGRKIMKKESGNITVDDEIIEVEVFDHMIQDGDIVSLNFNGEWVLKRHKLTSKPFSLKLKLNPSGKNFLVLHAENLGQRPPNTMAVSYFARGKKQQYIMNSDLNTSEVIEILTK